jgi:hypothetical protein
MSLLATAALAACDAGGDASCAACGVSFTDNECNQIAQSQGCTSGESIPDTVCTTPTRGCQFHGCPAGEIMCSLPNDGGVTDSGATDAGD